MDDFLALRLGLGRTASAAPVGGEPAAILLIVAGQSNANKNGTHGESVPSKYSSLSDAWIWNPSETAFEPYVCGENSSDAGSHATAWGSEAEFIHLLNSEFPGARITVTIGGVSNGWSVTTGTESPDYDAATQAILDRIADLESPALSGAHAAALDSFVRAAKDADFWDDIAVAYLFAVPSDRDAALINIRDPAGTLAAEGGSGSWSATAGYNPGAAAGNAIDLRFNPSAQPQNTVALCAWFSGISANSSYDFRSTAGSGNLFGMYRRNNGDWRFNLNNANATRTGLTVDPGFYMAARTASAAISFYGPAGTLIDTATTASGTPAASDLFLGHPTAAPSNDAIAAALLFNVAIDATKAQAIRDALNALGVAWGWTGATP